MRPAVHPTLLLASASPARLATLRSAGVEPVVQVSSVDEDAAVAAAEEMAGAPLEAADVALLLARAKAEDVVATLERDGGPGNESRDAADEAASDGDGAEGGQDADGILVLGCDSVLELDGEVHGKPVDAAQAAARWRRMRGRAGVLHTGHWLVDLRDAGTGGSGGMVGGTASTTVHFADLDDAEVEAYVATGEPLHVAGAFTLDGLGGPYVRGIEGDPSNVIGVSLPLLRELVGELGVAWHDLRTSPVA
jgi:septum formation protein